MGGGVGGEGFKISASQQNRERQKLGLASPLQCCCNSPCVTSISSYTKLHFNLPLCLPTSSSILLFLPRRPIGHLPHTEFPISDSYVDYALNNYLTWCHQVGWGCNLCSLVLGHLFACQCVYVWSNLNSVQDFYVCSCGFSVWPLKTAAFLSTHPPRHLTFSRSSSLTHFNTHPVSCSTFHHSSPISLPSLYPSICGRDELTICCSGRAWKGLRGREGVRQRGGEQEVLWYCNCSQNRIEPRGRERRYVYHWSRRQSRINRDWEKDWERKTEEERGVWYCYCRKANSGSP